MTVNNIDKNALRQKCRALRNSFGEEFIERASAKVCELLSKTREFELADTVLLYYPIKNEISPLSLFHLAKSLGKTVAFPVCIKKDGNLVFRAIEDLSSLHKAEFGLLEPNEDMPTVTATDRTVCIVPAILFSRKGHRIGYGMGYYDRFLKDFTGTSIGISYSELLYSDIPDEEHDAPLNMIITESEVLYFDFS